MYLAYSFRLALAMLVALPYFAVQGLRHGKYWRNLVERLGRLPAELVARATRSPGALWIHAVSVGEVVAAAPLAAQDAVSALARAQRAYDGMTTLRAGFTQTLINPMLGTPETSHGELFLQPPGRFSMRFTDPAGDRIVADGTWLWIYTPSSVPDQVIRQVQHRQRADTPPAHHGNDVPVPGRFPDSYHILGHHIFHTAIHEITPLACHRCRRA